VEDFISAVLMNQMLTRVDELNQSERCDDGAFRNPGASISVLHLGHQRLSSGFVQHPDVMAAMGKLLGDFILSGFCSRTPPLLA
jgi:hypothetical protein